ncbi:MAG: hypothetical protein BWX99_02556 [Deltaproteobacteria bacterium ADurb.Bin151]|nr:MAG: hypothetical protein BWX99_02556 [Deltaproteobacteria bacterium ADurb.Bin151]
MTFRLIAQTGQIQGHALDGRLTHQPWLIPLSSGGRVFHKNIVETTGGQGLVRAFKDKTGIALAARHIARQIQHFIGSGLTPKSFGDVQKRTG